jgi:hypothetical protein
MHLTLLHIIGVALVSAVIVIGTPIDTTLVIASGTPPEDPDSIMQADSDVDLRAEILVPVEWTSPPSALNPGIQADSDVELHAERFVPVEWTGQMSAPVDNQSDENRLRLYETMVVRPHFLFPAPTSLHALAIS